MKLKVKNWRTFQHYKDRNPPWIKLHFTLLSSADWVALADASRVLAVACMLIASRNDGEIDVSRAGIEYLKRVAYLNSEPDFKPLIECGFLEYASALQADASVLLANSVSETENLIHTETPLAADDSANRRPQKQPGIRFDDSTASFVGITEEQELRWQDAYPAVPIPPAIAQAAAWLKANPANRKKNCERFLVNWFSRAQEKAPRVSR